MNRAIPLRRKNRPRFIITSVVLFVNISKNESEPNVKSEMPEIKAIMIPNMNPYDFLTSLIFTAKKMFSIEAKIRNQRTLPLIKYGAKIFQFSV
jgi:hypothetical protein